LYSTDFHDFFRWQVSMPTFAIVHLQTPSSHSTQAALKCTHFWWSMTKNTQTVKTNRIMSLRSIPYLNLVAKKVLTLLKKSFSYTFLCTKSCIPLHLMYLWHWSIAKNTQTVKTNRMSPRSTPHLNLVTRKVLMNLARPSPQFSNKKSAYITFVSVQSCS